MYFDLCGACNHALCSTIPLDPKIERALRRQQRQALPKTVEIQGEGEVTIELPPIEPMTEEMDRRAL